MHAIFIWTTTRGGGRSETRQLVRSLEDLRDLLDSKTHGRTFYLEERAGDDSEAILDFFDAAYRVFENPSARRKPIYRCRDNWDHFESNDSNCEGKVFDTPLGYLYEADNGKPLYRCLATNGDRFVTRELDECTATGAHSEEILRYSP